MNKIKDKLKFCIVSCSPHVCSGYGQGTKDLIDMLLELGHEACVYSVFGTQGQVQEYKGCKIYPKNINGDTLADLDCVKWIEKYDVVWSFVDLFILDARRMTDYWMSWLMVDSEPFLISNLEALSQTNVALTMGDWSKNIIEENNAMGVNQEQMVETFPLVINSDDFYMTDKEEARQLFMKNYGLKEMNRLICCNAANSNEVQERKNFPELIKWWSKHTKENPLDVLYLHTDVTGEVAAGTNIKALCATYGYDTTKVRFAQNVKYRFGMITRDDLRDIYNASDIMLVPSHSEGLGLPYVESAMCGCIPVGNNYGTGKEVIEACNGVTINCRPNYYIQFSQKSKSFAEDIEVAVAEALTKSESYSERVLCSHDATKNYSIKNNLKNLEGLLEKVKNHMLLLNK